MPRRSAMVSRQRMALISSKLQVLTSLQCPSPRSSITKSPRHDPPPRPHTTTARCASPEAVRSATIDVFGVGADPPMARKCFLVLLVCDRPPSPPHPALRGDQKPLYGLGRSTAQRDRSLRHGAAPPAHRPGLDLLRAGRLEGGIVRPETTRTSWKSFRPNGVADRWVRSYPERIPSAHRPRENVVNKTSVEAGSGHLVTAHAL